jgi:nodulation protein E
MAASAIVGLGIVSSLGLSVERFASAVLAGTCAISDLANRVQADQPIRLGAPVRDFDPAAHFDARTAGQLDRFTQFAVVAARQAWRQSAIGPGQIAPERLGVVIGTGVGGLDVLDATFRAVLLGNLRPAPLTVPMTMGNAPASRISFETGARGPSFGVTSACASAAQAILLGHTLIQSGQVDACVVGGTDSCFSDGFLRAWDSLKVLSPEPCRPFSAGRRGLSMGEGAGILVLESLASAQRRGASIVGYMLGGGMSSDAGGLLAPDPRGMARAMRLALEDAGTDADAIDYINAHGTGTVANDRCEAEAINAVFGARAEPVRVSSTKAMMGHCMGAAGALEAIATLAALDAQIVPPTVNMTSPAPDCPIDATPNRAVAAPLRLALSNSFAFGGANCALVLGSGTGLSL